MSGTQYIPKKYDVAPLANYLLQFLHKSFKKLGTVG